MLGGCNSRRPTNTTRRLLMANTWDDTVARAKRRIKDAESATRKQEREYRPHVQERSIDIELEGHDWDELQAYADGYCGGSLPDAIATVLGAWAEDYRERNDD